MNETERYFTTTIVGAPQRLVMGRQVRFDLDPILAGPGGSSRLATGRLAIRQLAERLLGILSRIGQSVRATAGKGEHLVSSAKSSLATSNERPAGRVRGITYVAWTAPTLAVLAAFAYMASGWKQEFDTSKSIQLATAPPQGPSTTASGVPPASTSSGAPGLPMEPAVAQADAGGSGMTLVDGPAPMVPVPSTVLQKEGLPLDRKVPTVVLTPAPAPSAAPTQTLPAKSTQAERGKEEKPDRSVVVDVASPPEKRAEPVVVQKEEEPTSPRKFAQPSEAKPTQAQITPTQQKPESVRPAEVKAKAERVTVVDIAPDASYVLITNPQTRLPQRYTNGQKIFTGETIKSIDPKAGQLVLDSRTVTME